MSGQDRILRADGGRRCLQASHEPYLTAPDGVKDIIMLISWVVRWWTGGKGCELDAGQPFDLDAANQGVQGIGCHREDGLDKDVHLHGDPAAGQLSDSPRAPAFCEVV
jgi:hypothetical protein